MHRWHLLLLFWVLLAVPVPSHAAVDCDGVDDAATGLALSTYLTASAKTLTVWYVPSGTPPAAGSCGNVATQSIVAHTAGISRLNIVRRTATLVCTNHHDGAAADQLSGTVTDGTLMHLAFTHTGGVNTLYINGVVAQSGASGDLSTLTPLLTVCGNTGLFAHAQGRIEEVVVSPTAFDANEIAVLASSRRPRLRRTPASGNWLFDNCPGGASGDGVLFRDHSGNARTLTGNDGANNTGLTCQATRALAFGGGIQ